MPAVFKRIEGRNGRIEVPHLGATIGSLAGFTLTRRAETGEDSELWDLHAVLSLVPNKAIWDDLDYPKVVIVQVGKGSMYRLEPKAPGQRVTLNGRSLMMERVALCREI